MKAIIPVVICSAVAFFGMQYYMGSRGGEPVRTKKRRAEAKREQAEAAPAKATSDQAPLAPSAIEPAPRPAAVEEPNHAKWIALAQAQAAAEPEAPPMPGVPRVVPFDYPKPPTKPFEVPPFTYKPPLSQPQRMAKTGSAAPGSAAPRASSKEMYFTVVGVGSNGIPERVWIKNTPVGNCLVLMVGGSSNDGRLYVRKGQTAKNNRWEVHVANGVVTVTWDGQNVPPGFDKK